MLYKLRGLYSEICIYIHIYTSTKKDKELSLKAHKWVYGKVNKRRQVEIMKLHCNIKNKQS